MVFCSCDCNSPYRPKSTGQEYAKKRTEFDVGIQGENHYSGNNDVVDWSKLTGVADPSPSGLPHNAGIFLLIMMNLENPNVKCKCEFRALERAPSRLASAT